jgi:hypothetical protein
LRLNTQLPIPTISAIDSDRSQPVIPMILAGHHGVRVKRH